MKHHFSLIILSLLLSGKPGWLAAQTIIDAELSLNVESIDFADGFTPREPGVINLHITNHGPNPVTVNDEFQITLAYNLTQDSDLVFEILYSPTTDPNCEFIFSNASPRPPVDDFLYFYNYHIRADIPVGETYTCGINVRFNNSGDLDTIWQLRYITPNGVMFDDAPFEFRGLPMAVPLPLAGTLLVVLMLLAAGYFRHRAVVLD